MELTQPFEQLTYSLTVTCAAEFFQDLYQKIDTLISLQRHEFNLKYTWISFFFSLLLFCSIARVHSNMKSWHTC